MLFKKVWESRKLVENTEFQISLISFAKSFFKFLEINSKDSRSISGEFLNLDSHKNIKRYWQDLGKILNKK